MSPKLYRRWGIVGLSCALLVACASKVPKELRQPIPKAPLQAQAQSEPDRYLGRHVRWGGEILGLHNATDLTEVEIFGRALFSDGEPRPDGGEGVRFVARVQGFLDPAEYQNGKRLTVLGRLAGAVTRPVGEYAYVYPVVDADTYHLWPVYQPPQEPAWFRNPYYDPWGVWGPWGPWGPYRHYPYGW